MITIISGTNRKDNVTRKVASEYQRFLKEKQFDSEVLFLDEVNMTERNDEFSLAEEKFLISAEKFIIISPEYNGSYPGILKLMIDNSNISQCWWHKKVLLTGISTGRAGNLRGMEHLTGSLLHMKMQVHHNRLPISVINTLMKDDNFTDANVLKAIDNQLEEFLNF